jgi:hypothetical protein
MWSIRGISGAGGGGSGAGGVSKPRRLGRVSADGPGDGRRTENRQHDAGIEIAFEDERQDTQGRARRESDRHLAWLLSQPRLQLPSVFYSVFYLGQRTLPPNCSPSSEWGLGQDSASRATTKRLPSSGGGGRSGREFLQDKQHQQN